MVLYIDSTSRALAMRQLKKTIQFLEQFMSYKGGHHKKYPEENFHSFQFFKYHCFRMFTPGFLNIIVLECSLQEIIQFYFMVIPKK